MIKFTLNAANVTNVVDSTNEANVADAVGAANSANIASAANVICGKFGCRIKHTKQRAGKTYGRF